MPAIVKELHLQHATDSILAGVLALAGRIADTAANALVVGPSGVGKEALARYVHGRTRRAGDAMTRVRCDGADDEAVLRALFGDGRDPRDRERRFASHRAETLLLVEVSDLSPRVQATLMDALWAADSADPLRAERAVRVVATTTRDLRGPAAAGGFRRDLLDLFTCEVKIPPLCERRSDVPAVMNACWTQVGGGRDLTDEAMKVIRGQEWPGNVRQLAAFAARLAVVATGATIERRDVEAALPVEGCASAVVSPAMARARASADGRLDPAVVEAVRTMGLQAFLDRLEDTLIDWALASSGGTRKAAADLLQVKRTTLVEKLRRRERPLRARPNFTLVTSAAPTS
jgi:sigma-54 specific flagellar transcriptional regulator A